MPSVVTHFSVDHLLMVAVGIVYGGVPLAARSLLQYGITPIDSAKTDVTMQFYVENQL